MRDLPFFQGELLVEGAHDRATEWLRAHSDWIICRLPHFAVTRGGFYFLESTRPAAPATPELEQAFSSVDNEKSVQELLESGVEEHSLASLHAAEVVVTIPPPQKARGPSVLVVEPHPDDAVLSAGGALLRRRTSSVITILSVCSRTNGTSYMADSRHQFFDIDVITSLREKESLLAAKFLNAEYYALGEPDICIRYVESSTYATNPQQAMRDQGGHRHAPPKRALVDQLADRLWERIEQLSPDEIWIPLGLGNHHDHRLTRDACLQSLGKHWRAVRSKRIVMYEDLPYAVESRGTAGAVVEALRTRGASLEPLDSSRAEISEEKLECLKLYASQWKVSSLRPLLETLETETKSDRPGCAERHWHLLDPPRWPWPPIVINRADPTDAVEKRAREVFDQRSSVTRLQLLVAHSVGDWPRQAAMLLDLFPAARIGVLAPEENAHQFEPFRSPRLEISLFRRAIANALREVSAWGAHVNHTALIFAGPQRTRAAKLLATLLLTRRAYSFENLEDVCSLWRYWLTEIAH